MVLFFFFAKELDHIVVSIRGDASWLQDVRSVELFEAEHRLFAAALRVRISQGILKNAFLRGSTLRRRGSTRVLKSVQWQPHIGLLYSELVRTLGYYGTS